MTRVTRLPRAAVAALALVSLPAAAALTLTASAAGEAVTSEVARADAADQARNQSETVAYPAAGTQDDASVEATSDVTGDTAQIIGGQAATNPWIVQLRFMKKGDSYSCTGSAISAEWVLTARHCVSRIDSMKVFFSNSIKDRGEGVVADKWVTAPNFVDVALVHLSTPKQLDAYGQVSQSYAPRSGDTGDIYGYGDLADGKDALGLNTAKVRVDRRSDDLYMGKAAHVVGVDGAANHGDSGGPLVIGGQIVGVCSKGDVPDPKADIHAGAAYSNVTDKRDWIRQTAGV